MPSLLIPKEKQINKKDIYKKSFIKKLEHIDWTTPVYRNYKPIFYFYKRKNSYLFCYVLCKVTDRRTIHNKRGYFLLPWNRSGTDMRLSLKEVKLYDY